MTKRRLEEVREARLLDRWALGDVDDGQPNVVLTDLKTPSPAATPSSSSTRNSRDASPTRGLPLSAATASATSPSTGHSPCT